MDNILNKESKFFRKISLFWKEISKSIKFITKKIFIGKISLKCTLFKAKLEFLDTFIFPQKCTLLTRKLEIFSKVHFSS